MMFGAVGVWMGDFSMSQLDNLWAQDVGDAVPETEHTVRQVNPTDVSLIGGNAVPVLTFGALLQRHRVAQKLVV